MGLNVLRTLLSIPPILTSLSCLSLLSIDLPISPRFSPTIFHRDASLEIIVTPVANHVPSLFRFHRENSSVVDFYLCMCVWSHTYSKSMDQPGKVANPARGQLNMENVCFPVRVRA